VVWLNPDPPEDWERSQTCKVVKDVFPMYRLSVAGISEAVTALVAGRRQQAGARKTAT
jgi:uncharacterized protein with von Willebrand factor type A (vWA) domain